MHAADQVSQYPYDVPYTQQIGSTGQYNFIRKAASDFGWDWGPAFAPVGISKGIEIVAIEKVEEDDEEAVLPFPCLLEDVVIHQYHHYQHHGTDNSLSSVDIGVDVYCNALAVPDPLEGDQLAVVVKIEIESPRKKMMMTNNSSNIEYRWEVVYTTKLEKEREVAGLYKASHADRHLSTQTITLPPSSVDCWWPWDLVPPQAPSPANSLYTVTVTITPQNGSTGATQAITRRIGLRSIRLRREPTPSRQGETFQFEVNGVPVFARGANIVPLQLVPDGGEENNENDLAKELVRSARAANMNMLRAWGGGRYLPGRVIDCLVGCPCY